MSLATGTKLGPYEIVGQIGAGGIEFLIHVKSFFERISSVRV
jgi:hypothetical protein